MKLAIISHTEHYTADDGTLVGWSPTVHEINHLLNIFDIIYHLAMHYEGSAPESTMAYASERIQFIALPSVGGKRIKDKLGVIMQAPKVIRMVSKTLNQVDYFQLRTPTGIGMFLIPYLTLCVKKPGWFKYAGNWNQKNPPFGYALQRWMLTHQHRKVTINGQWADQPQQCLSFENPCLTDEDIQSGYELRTKKYIKGFVSFCFVGRLEKEKGVEQVIEAFKLLIPKDVQKVGIVHFVGEGQKLHYFKHLCDSSPINFQFHGALNRSSVFEIYKTSHFFLLPTTASEGFPKVIAEAMNFGSVPIVSNMSSIGQYIKEGHHGFLIDPITSDRLSNQIKKALYLPDREYRNYLSNANHVADLFTFSHYNNRILSEIIGK